MSSTFQILETSKNVRESFVDFGKKELPSYSIEDLSVEIKKGEKLFISKDSLLRYKSDLVKGDVPCGEVALDQIKKLEPFIIKGDGDKEDTLGYFLPVEKKED